MSTFAPGSFVPEWIKAQKQQKTNNKDVSVFNRNLEAELDAKRAQNSCLSLHTIPEGSTDFASADILGLGASGVIREAFLEEMARYPDAWLSSSGTRLAFGNTEYIETIEKEIAEYHGAEACMIAINAGGANGAVFTSIPRPGDAIVYDEFIHATVHDGMRNSLALVRKAFRHNSVDSLVETLVEIRDKEQLIRDGERCVIVCLEGIYSMDGDLPPVREIVTAAKEVFPKGNVEFYIDEAHSNGVLGPGGKGIVNAFGLEKEFALRVHSTPKALGSHGGIILCNQTVKNMIVNNSRSLMFSGSPHFPILAGMRASYNLLKAGKLQAAQDRVVYLANLFADKMTSHPVWNRANDAEILRVPIWDLDEEAQPFVTHICPVMTRPNTRHHLYLTFHLQLAGFIVYPIFFPVVPKGTERVRVIFHASQTDEQVQALVNCMCEWAEEMLQIDEEGDGSKLPKAARLANSLMEKEGLKPT